MAQGDIETVLVDGQWTNHVQGEGLSHLVFDTKDKAVAEGRRLAKDAEVEHIIKNEDGTVDETYSYADDATDLAG